MKEESRFLRCLVAYQKCQTEEDYYDWATKNWGFAIVEALKDAAIKDLKKINRG